MKYLINWIEKELNPEKHISSKSTSSEYFYFYGSKVRLSDHMTGHADNDLEIIRVMDLTGKNKQYIIKESSSPNMVTVPDVKTLKIVLSTFIFQFKNKYDNKQLQLASAEESLKNTFNVCLDKINSNTRLTLSDVGTINSYMNHICPQWMNMKEELRTLALHLFKVKVNVENVKDIIDLEFPQKNQNGWQSRDLKENMDCIIQYFPDDYNYTDYEVRVNDPLLKIKQESEVKKDLLTKYNELRNIGIDNLNDIDRGRFSNIFGSLIVENTGGRYSLLSQPQRKNLRLLATNNMPYEDILEFFNHTFTKKKGKLIPETTKLKEIVDKFLKLYNIGIIKYPDATDFENTYNENFPSETVVVEESNDNEVTNVMEENKVENNITDFIPDTDVTIKESYDYANAEFVNIKDIHEMFEENQLNILDDVIKKINDTNKYTSFETRRITDIFAKHYSDIWDKLTWTQKELCSSIITDERMNLNETDYIINKIFDKNAYTFPVTELCRKYIKEYSQHIKESRMAA